MKIFFSVHNPERKLHISFIGVFRKTLIGAKGVAYAHSYIGGHVIVAGVDYKDHERCPFSLVLQWAESKYRDDLAKQFKKDMVQGTLPLAWLSGKTEKPTTEKLLESKKHWKD